MLNARISFLDDEDYGQRGFRMKEDGYNLVESGRESIGRVRWLDSDRT